MPPFDPRALPFLTRKMLSFEKASTFRLFVRVVTTNTDPFIIRGFTRDGPFGFSITPTGNGGVETFSLNISDVPVSVSLIPSQNQNSNSYTHACIFLQINEDNSTLLAQGLVDQNFGIAWPSQLQNTPAQNFGLIHHITIADPAAGAEIDTNLPNHQVMEILGVSMRLTTNGTAADRTTKLVLGELPDIEYHFINTTTQQASETTDLLFIPGGTTRVITANQLHEIAIPEGIIMPLESVIKTVTTNIQSGDQYSNIRVKVRRWPQEL